MPAEYVPYGVEWERELMKWRKGDIIGLLRQALTKEEKFTSTNTPSMPCQAMNIHRVLLLAGVEKCPVCHKLLG
jgi:hypothetical protein